MDRPTHGQPGLPPPPPPQGGGGGYARDGGGYGGGYGGAPQYGGGGYGGGGGGGGYDGGHGYRCDDMGRVPADLAARVEAVLTERNSAKMQRDFTTADRLRDDLRNMGVIVFDKEKTWKLAGGGGGGGGGYGGAPGGGYGGGGGGSYGGSGGGSYGGGVGPSGHDYTRDDDGSVAVDVPKIDAILAQRMQAKMGRDFATADRLRDELKSIGVMVFDKEKTWKAAGAARTPYASGGGGPGGPGGGGYYQPPPQAAPYGGGGGGGYGAPPPPAPAASYGAPPAGRGGAYDAGRSGQRGYEDKESYNRAVLEGRVQYRAPEDEEDQRFARRDRERGRPEGERSRDRDRDRDRDREYDQRERPRRPEDGGAPR